MSRAPLEAVLFDYGHTLIHFDDQPHARLVEAYERINHLLRDVLAREVPDAQSLIRDISMAVDDEIQRDYATGRPEEIEIAGVYDRALRRIGLELEPELIERVMELEQDGWLGSVHVGSEVPATLERTRAAGLKVGLVSNAAYRPGLMRRQLQALGLLAYFDSLTFSSEVGWRKPHPAIYRDALAKLGISPEAALFVGDRLREDVRGPKSLGMRAVLLREWRQDEDPGGEADFTAARLGEVWDVIAGLVSKGPNAADGRKKQHN
jgi:putative hydrolase of the HAD superfamily